VDRGFQQARGSTPDPFGLAVDASRQERGPVIPSKHCCRILKMPPVFRFVPCTGVPWFYFGITANNVIVYLVDRE
jgi:hypothetical protein